jgi:hypothetical protein
MSTVAQSRALQGRRTVANAIRWGLALLAVVVLSGSLYVLGMFIVSPERGEEFTVGLRPPQYFSELDSEQRVFSDNGYASVFGVAHNSGDRIDSTLEALVYGSDVIEVDVVSLDGTLYSSHTPPLPFLGQRWFRGPELTRVGTAAYQADAIKLDLKETTPEFVRLVAEFVNTYGKWKPILVASRDSQVLRALQSQAPEAIRLLSVPDARALEQLRRDPALLELINGITVRHTAIDADSAEWLNDAGLLVFAWTVNDLERVNELIGLGVDGITSDNLALLNLLGGQARGERIVPLGTPELRE